MIFGIAVRPQVMVVLGLTALAVLVFQMLVGYRKIRFKGGKHLRMHKRIGWALLVIAGVHGLLGLASGVGIRIG